MATSRLVKFNSQNSLAGDCWELNSTKPPRLDAPALNFVHWQILDLARSVREEEEEDLSILVVSSHRLEGMAELRKKAEETGEARALLRRGPSPPITRAPPSPLPACCTATEMKGGV